MDGSASSFCTGPVTGVRSQLIHLSLDSELMRTNAHLLGKHMYRSILSVLFLSWSLSASALGIESVTFLVDDDGSPGDEVEAFLATDRVQHFEIKLDEVKAGNHDYVVEFWAVETDAASDVKVTEFKVNGLLVNTINANISLPRDWPIGSYRFDLKMDGKLVDSYDYEVGEP